MTFPTNFDLSRVAGKLQDRVLSNNVVALHDYRLTQDKRLAKIVLSFTAKPESTQEAANLVRSTFKNKVDLLPFSFREIATPAAFAVTGYVKPNRPVKPYDNNGQYMTMASNILMDKHDESLWEVRETAAGKMLCRQEDENLSELFELARTRKVGMPRLSDFTTASVPISQNTFVCYASSQQQRVRYGYILANSYLSNSVNPDDEYSILPFDADNKIEDAVPAEQIIEAASLNRTDAQYAGVGDTPDGLSLEQYYRKLFSYAPEYYQKLMDMLKQRAAV
jgi:hypothetical protein